MNNNSLNTQRNSKIETNKFKINNNIYKFLEKNRYENQM